MPDRDVRKLLLEGAFWLGRFALVVALPFWLLVRGSLLAHTGLGASPPLAILTGVFAATLWIAGVAWWLWHRLTGRHRFRAIAARVVLPGVVVFSLYALLWVSSANVKTPELRSFYRQIHPVLRVGLGTLIVFDPEIVITDISRRPGDYEAIGLPVRARSLHYAQEDGWVHAVDLRTRGRSAVRNGLVRLYFFAMGFDSLRHGGSQDHLHVWLPPGGIGLSQTTPRG